MSEIGDLVTVNTPDFLRPDGSFIRHPLEDMRAVLAVLSRARDAEEGRLFLEMLGLTTPSDALSQDRYDPARLAHAARRPRRRAKRSGGTTGAPDSGGTDD